MPMHDEYPQPQNPPNSRPLIEGVRLEDARNEIVALRRDNERLRAERERYEKDAERLDWLEGELEREGDNWQRSLFRRNVPITREAIDEARAALSASAPDTPTNEVPK